MDIIERTKWKDGLKPENSYPSLDKDIECDVAVVGGGLTGILAGYFLACEGFKPILIEAKKTIGAYATAHTTAFINAPIDTSLTDLVELFGENNAKLIWESGFAATNEIERIVDKEKIECEFIRCPYIEYANLPQDFPQLADEYEISKKLGFETELKRDTKLGFPNAGYFMVENQAKFHPIKFLNQLADKATDLGLKIYTNTEAKEIKPGFVVTNGGIIKTRKVLIATYQPFNNPWSIFLKKGMYRSYVYVLEIPKKLIPEGTYVDSNNPYHYFRIDQKENFYEMIIGGEDHRKELKTEILKKKSYKALEEYFIRLLNGKNYKIQRRWDGPILEPSDGIALIGEIEKDQFVATAFSGNGMTYAMIAAMMFRDYVLEKNNSWAEIYDPNRKIKIKTLLKKGKQYSEEFFHGAVKNVFK